MGWGRLLLLGDIGQQFDIAEAQETLAELRTDVARIQVGDESTDKRIARLESENDELKLYLVAVVRLLRKKETISQSELNSIVAQIDASDGSLDGRYSGDISTDS
jgi:multidrug resistance efflux pump